MSVTSREHVLPALGREQNYVRASKPAVMFCDKDSVAAIICRDVLLIVGGYRHGRVAVYGLAIIELKFNYWSGLILTLEIELVLEIGHGLELLIVVDDYLCIFIDHYLRQAFWGGMLNFAVQHHLLRISTDWLNEDDYRTRQSNERIAYHALMHGSSSPQPKLT